MKIHNVVIPVFLFLFVSAFAADKKEGIVGGYTPIKNFGAYTPIKNLSDPHVVEIAEFAVTQYGKQSGKKLSLVKIIKGESQVVNGINYRLTLTANDGSHTQSYVAVIYEKQNFKKLTSFKSPGVFLGGWKTINNISDPHVVEIAQFAVTQYGKQSGKKFSLVKIIKGETQVVSGINYRLVLTVNDGPHTQSYIAVVYEKHWEHFRNLTSFTPIKEKGMLGAYTPIKNLSDPHVVEIAEFAVTQYGKQSGKKLSLVKIIKGESQVVNGINYRLTLTANDGSHTQSYVAVVYEKQNFKKLTSFKSQEVFPGGYTPIKNLSDPHVHEIAEFAVTEYGKQFGKKLSLVKIIKGETQVVNGINYRLTLTANDGSHTQSYVAVVYEKQNFKKLTSFTPIKKEGIVGAWTPIKNLHDPHVVEIAQFAVTQYDKQSGNNLILVEIVKGYTQVVTGTNYRLVLTGKHGFHTQNYEAVVWEKPWEHFRNLTSFNPLLG